MTAKVRNFIMFYLAECVLRFVKYVFVTSIRTPINVHLFKS